MKNNKRGSLRAAFALGCALLSLCANPLKEKGPFWYNGYVYGTRAFSLYSEGNINGAIASYRKGLAEAQRLDIPRQSGLYTFNLGRCWLELDKYDSALACFTGAYREFIACRDSAAAARTAGFVALTHIELGAIDSGFSWYSRGTGMAPGKEERALWLSLHGRLVWARDHGREALTYFEEACALYRKQKAYHAMAQMCRLRAGVYCYFSDFQEAKKLIDEALSLSDRSEQRPDRFRILLAASSIYNRLNDLPAGRRFFERAKNCAPAGHAPLPSFEDFQKSGKDLFQQF
jgi:tetratricopeptide (TPR) repeat protein